MSTWGITVIVSLVVAMISMGVLFWIQQKQKEPYSYCFWKGFLVVFLIVVIIFVALKITGHIQKAMFYGLPVAFGAGSLVGLLTEIVRNRLYKKGFWKNC